MLRSDSTYIPLRNVLSKILKDYRAVREFEDIFGAVWNVIPENLLIISGDINSLIGQVSVAQQTANEALDMIEGLPVASTSDKVNSVSFSQFPPGIGSDRAIYFDNDEKQFINKLNGIQVLGSTDTTLLVKNNSGLNMIKGDVVYVSSSDGETPLISLAIADGSIIDFTNLAILIENIDDGQSGLALTYGKAQMDTSGFTNGDSLYISSSSAGELVVTPPTYPNPIIKIGIVLDANVNGKILFNPETVFFPAYFDGNSSSTITAVAINTIYTINLDSGDGCGISFSGDDIEFSKSGAYLLNINAHVTNTGILGGTFALFIKKNGSNISGKSIIQLVPPSTSQTLSLSTIIPISNGDIINISFSVTDTSIQIDTVSSTPYSPTQNSLNVSISEIS